MTIKLEVVSNRIPDIARLFPATVDRLVRQQVFVTEGDVKSNIVKYDAIDTGNMLNSVRGASTGQAAGEVVAHAEYSAYVNYGTRFMPGRPYFGEAIETAKTEFPQRFKNEFGSMR